MQAAGGLGSSWRAQLSHERGPVWREGLSGQGKDRLHPVCCRFGVTSLTAWRGPHQGHLLGSVSFSFSVK